VPPADEKAVVKLKSKSIPTFHKVNSFNVLTTAAATVQQLVP